MSAGRSLPSRCWPLRIGCWRPTTSRGRICLCNGLLTTAGFAQLRPGGYVEPPVITGGADYRGVADLLDALPHEQEFYSASDVISYLREDSHRV
jgi:hypothetical protein